MEKHEIVYSQDLYTAYLRTISGLKFTTREIDIISCIAQGKSLKGVASFLSTQTKQISARSVETHILNIRRKIGGSSRESIITFIEKSDKYQYLRQYYVALFIQKEFEQCLQQILKVLKPHNNSFLLISFEGHREDEIQRHSDSLINNLEGHLQLLGAKLEKKDTSHVSNLPSILASYQKYQNIICLLQNMVEDGSKEVNDMLAHSVSEADVSLIKRSATNSGTANASSTKSTKPHIICLVPKGAEYINAMCVVPNAQYIDTAQVQNYYFLFCDILQKCYNITELDSVITRFRTRYDNIHISLSCEQRSLVNNDTQVLPTTDSAVTEYHNNTTWLTNIFVKAIQAFENRRGILVFVSVVIVILGFYKTLEYYKSTSTSCIDQTMAEINKVTAKVTQNCSSNNITTRDRENNHRFIKQMEHVVLQLKSEQIHDYFNDATSPPEHLMNLLYSLCVLANYHNINDYDGTKARSILYDAKLLAQQYVRNRSKLRFDFDSLSNDRIYTEIKDFPDLRELYTVIVYLIGRTYTYQGDRSESIKYFELSKYLGTELGLFVGYLSNIGIAKAQKKEIVQAIQNQRYDEAISKINTSISLYKSLKQDNTEYKDSFRPGLEPAVIKYNKMVPANNKYNRVECAEEISRYCFLLLYIACYHGQNTEHQVAGYLREISNQYIGNSQSPGILKLLPALGAKKIACAFNTLGNILLLLHDNNINAEQLNEAICRELNLQDGEIVTLQNHKNRNHALALIKHIFTFAEKQSRQSDYTKADAHHGLQALYTRLLKQDTVITEAQRQDLITSITFHTSERDRINKELNRVFNAKNVLEVICR